MLSEDKTTDEQKARILEARKHTELMVRRRREREMRKNRAGAKKLKQAAEDEDDDEDEEFEEERMGDDARASSFEKLNAELDKVSFLPKIITRKN